MGQILLRDAPRLVVLHESAYHEAGHAVIARRLGYRVTRVSLWPDGTGQCSTKDPRSEFRSDADTLDVFVGGVAAQARFSGRWDWASAGYDLEVALRLAHDVNGWSSRALGPRARVGEAATCIYRLFETDDTLWREVCRMSHRLVSRYAAKWGLFDERPRLCGADLGRIREPMQEALRCGLRSWQPAPRKRQRSARTLQ